MSRESLLSPLEKMRAREESIILMRDGTTKRLRVRQRPIYDDNPHIVTGERKIYVRPLDPPEMTPRGLPIEWEELPS